MRILSFISMITFLLSSNVYAVGRYSGVSERFNADQGQGAISEFVYQREMNDVLIPVYLLGAVAKPGLYHVPIHTDLFSLLALAGGTIKEAELGKIQIKRALVGHAPTLLDVDLEKDMREDARNIASLSNNDVILIPTKEPTFSNNTVMVLGVVGTVLGIVLASIAISQTRK